MPLVRIGERAALDGAARHHITLRNVATNAYHSVCMLLADAVLFSFHDAAEKVYYCMEAACPHLGAPLENAPIERQGEDDDVEDMVVVWYVCA